MRVISQPEFEREAKRFLSGAPVQDGPMPYDDLVASRASRPDPDLAGTPEKVRIRAEMLLPLPEAPIRVRLYRDARATPQPLLLWLHGGAFVGGSLDDIDVACASLARRTGLTVLSLDYRLAPEHPFPAAVHDTYDAISWLEEHGEAVGGDGRLIAGGQSAGANLVAAACLMARDRGRAPVARQVLCYPWLDLGTDSESHRRFDGIDGVQPGRDEWYRSQYLAGQAATPYSAPLLAPDLAGLPPALVLGAGLDPLRDDARRWAERLNADAVEATYLEYANTPHAFMNFPGALSVASRALQDIADDLTSFLHTRPPEQDPGHDGHVGRRRAT